MPPAPRLACLLACALGACSSGGTAATGDAVAGRFTILLKSNEPPAFTDVSGVVKDGPTPELAPTRVAMTDGACVLLVPMLPFCSPECGAGMGCVAGDQCQRYPGTTNVGAVSLTGVKTESGGSSLTLASANGVYLADPGMTAAFPPFDEGADVALHASGGDYAGFEVHARGIAPLVVPDGALTLQRGVPLAITWTAKGAGSDARIHVRLEVSHHGGASKGRVECNAPDTGALAISAALATALLDLGTAGYPSIEIDRLASGSAPVAAGRVWLQLLHPVLRDITIPGLVSCGDPMDCPVGQTCRDDETCGPST